MTDQVIVPEGYHPQENGESDKPNYTDRQGNETWLYSCANCGRLQTVDQRPTGGQWVDCRGELEDDCGKEFVILQSRLYDPNYPRITEDARGPVIERNSEVD